MRKRAYLAQAIEGRPSGEILRAAEWMSALVGSAGYDSVVPYEDVAMGRGVVLAPSNIVERDLSLLASSDLVLADLSVANHEYIGCICELTYASVMRKPSIVYVGDTGRETRKWLRHHADMIVTSRQELDVLFEHLRVYQEIAASLPAYYDTRAVSYDDAYLCLASHDDPATNMQWKEELLRAESLMMPFLQGQVIDLACGTAWWRPKMVSAGHVTCVDLSPEMLAVATGRCSTQTSFLLADVRDSLPFKDNEFDSCFLSFWIGLLDPINLKQRLEEVSRVVRSDGWIVVLDTRKERFSDRYRFGGWDLQYRGADTTPFLKRYFDANQLKRVLLRFGNNVETAETGTYFVVGRYQNKKNPFL